MVLKEERIKELRKRLMELTRGIKAKQAIKTTSPEQVLALKIARKEGQVVYGSSSSSVYAPGIKPKDLDISAKNPRLAALRLKKELLIRKGIAKEVKKKYIQTMKKNIYEVGSVSYSPIDKKKIINAVMRNRLKTTSLQKEVHALSGTVSNPYTDYRTYKDFYKLKEIKEQLPKERQEEYGNILKELEKEKLRRRYIYSQLKTERLNKMKVATLKEERIKKQKWL